MTQAAGLAVESYGLGVAAADYDNDGNVDLYVTASAATACSATWAAGSSRT